MSIDETVETIFRKVMGLGPEPIATDLEFTKMAGWDSLRAAEMLIALQKEFRVKFGVPELKRMTSLRAIQETIRGKLGPR